MIKIRFPKAFVLGLSLAAMAGAVAFSPKEKPVPMPPVNDREKSLQAFSKILTVLKSPRCINCHPSGDVPHQGDDQHLHGFGVTRGKDDHGTPVQQCSTCHHDSNTLYSNVPGAPHWALAPLSMAWFGLSDAEIGQALIDRKKNGNKTPLQLVDHMSNDSLVLWAWKPGYGRTLPPVPLDEF